ncbi:RNA-splicing factor [Serendipita sp. 400]|nr:RNA-splicing factor [Serendipita sp. 400]
MRNISYLRSHDSAADRAAMEAPPMKHREPDKEILEHERKRKIEVACYELRVQLEDEELPEEQIEARVDALRTQLLEKSQNSTYTRQQFKPSDTHAILAAKKVEMERMARALGTSDSYVEGKALDNALLVLLDGVVRTARIEGVLGPDLLQVPGPGHAAQGIGFEETRACRTPDLVRGVEAIPIVRGLP